MAMTAFFIGCSPEPACWLSRTLIVPLVQFSDFGWFWPVTITQTKVWCVLASSSNKQATDTPKASHKTSHYSLVSISYDNSSSLTSSVNNHLHSVKLSYIIKVFHSINLYHCSSHECHIYSQYAST